MQVIGNLSTVVNTGLTYVLNGFLFLLYWLVGFLPGILSLLCGVFLMLSVDREVQNRANYRPFREGSYGNVQPISTSTTSQGIFGDLRKPHTAQIITLIVLALWMIAQTGMAEPIPWIGAVMWIVGVLVIFAMPGDRKIDTLWFVKSLIAIYAVLVIGSRLYLAYTAQLSAEQWATVIGTTTEGATTVIANTRGNVTTMIMWALWFVAPLGYFSLLIQKLTVNPIALLNPLAGANDVLKQLRNRD
jgi:hypothetical protein